jgi:hypothetical protein
MERIGEIPCARNSLLSGIASGVGIGVVRGLSVGTLRTHQPPSPFSPCRTNVLTRYRPVRGEQLGRGHVHAGFAGDVVCSLSNAPGTGLSKRGLSQTQDDMSAEYSRGAAPRADYRRAASQAGDSKAVRGLRGTITESGTYKMVYSLLENMRRTSIATRSSSRKHIIPI